MKKYIRDNYLEVLDKYLKTLSVYFEKTPVDVESPDLLLRLIYELAESINLLLRENRVWQSEIFKRVLGETTILVFVVCNLKAKTQKAYLALYELQGWHEVLGIFEKLDVEKHKEGKWPELIKKRVKKLETLVLEEFKSSKNEIISDRDFKKYVRNKLSRGIYTDAKIIAERKYKDFPEIQNAVSKLLKNVGFDKKEGGLYQAESNFVHARYFAAILMVKKNEKLLVKNRKTIVRDTLSRIHLALTAYAVEDDSMTSLVDDLAKIMRGVPKIFS